MSSSTLQSLIKDTAIYGLSSMFGRFLNWLLTFVYVKVMVPEEFGVMTNLYAWTAILMILLTYGMETTFFRFANKHERPEDVYTTTLYALGGSSLLFVLIGLAVLSPLTEALHVAGQSRLIVYLLIIVASDAFMAIPLGYLRYEQRPWRFFRTYELRTRDHCADALCLLCVALVGAGLSLSPWRLSSEGAGS